MASYSLQKFYFFKKKYFFLSENLILKKFSTPPNDILHTSEEIKLNVIHFTFAHESRSAFNFLKIFEELVTNKI